MDILTGLQAATTAISLVKDLREIDRGVDEAEFKLKLAELANALADTKISLAEAKQTLASLEAEVAELSNGEICPKCRNGRMQLIDTRHYPMRGLGSLGVEEWNFQCNQEDCMFEQTKLHDPHGAIPAEAKKR